MELQKKSDPWSPMRTKMCLHSTIQEKTIQNSRRRSPRPVLSFWNQITKKMIQDNPSVNQIRLLNPHHWAFCLRWFNAELPTQRQETARPQTVRFHFLSLTKLVSNQHPSPGPALRIPHRLPHRSVHPPGRKANSTNCSSQAHLP